MIFLVIFHVRIQRGVGGGGGGRGSGPSLKIMKKYRGFSNTVPDPLNNHKATKPVFNIEPSFKWRFAGGPMMVRL